MEQLRLWRQEGAREAQAIADIVEQQFPSISRLGDERMSRFICFGVCVKSCCLEWAVYEQAFIACLDLPNKAALAEVMLLCELSYPEGAHEWPSAA